MKIEIKGNKESERFILIILLGIVEGLLNKKIYLDEMEYVFLNPYTYLKLKKQKISKKIVLLLEKMCELEDVLSLIPEKYIESLNDLKKDIEKELEISQKYSENSLKWLD